MLDLQSIICRICERLFLVHKYHLFLLGFDKITIESKKNAHRGDRTHDH